MMKFEIKIAKKIPWAMKYHDKIAYDRLQTIDFHNTIPIKKNAALPKIMREIWYHIQTFNSQFTSKLIND